jgi:hypothetical protein
MRESTKQTLYAWSIVAGCILIGVAIGYSIGNDPSLDELEERMQGLQLQASVVNAECIEELEARDRVMRREFNIFNSTEPTNGI